MIHVLPFLSDEALSLPLNNKVFIILDIVRETRPNAYKLYKTFQDLATKFTLPIERNVSLNTQSCVIHDGPPVCKNCFVEDLPSFENQTIKR